MTQAAPTFVRWLWIWITVGALVVVVVVGFLIGIVSSLESIDDALFEADEAVTGARADTDPLPTFIQDINKNLTSIDKSLKPIRGQAGEILLSLRSIQGSLTDVDGSLVNTSSSLVDTSGSLQDTSASLVDTSGKLGNITGLLVDTSGTLQTISASLVSTSGTLGGVSGSLVDTSGVLRRVDPSLVDVSEDLVSVRRFTRDIDTTLQAAQSRNSLGTNAIWRRVRFLNGGAFIRNNGRNDNDTSLAGPNNNPNGLVPVKVDADNIIIGLGSVNEHLTSICRAPVLGPNPPNILAGLLETLGLVRQDPRC